MAIRVGAKVLGWGVALLAVTGCARVSVETRKSQDYDKKLDRLLVVYSELDRFSAEYRKLLRDRTVVEFEKHGVAASVGSAADRLALDEGPSIEAQAKGFNASTALLVKALGGTVDTTGRVLNADMDAQLFDVASRKRIWRGKIAYSTGGSLNTDADRAGKLVVGIVDALDKDGLFAPPGMAAPGAFPRVMGAQELAAHFEHRTSIEARLGPQAFTLLIHPDKHVERECPGCKMVHGSGQMTIDADRAVVCFSWDHTRFPDSGCYRLIQNAADRFTLRGVDQERPIEYTAAQ